MKKTFDGVVVSAKMKDSAIVEVTRKAPHPLYRRVLKRTKKYKVSTGGRQVQVGDRVKIVETRPISKDKHFEVLEVGK